MSAAARNMMIGGLICVVGIGVTAATYSAAKAGGTYVVAYGAIAVGALQFVVGLFQKLAGAGDGKEGKDVIMIALHAMAYVAATDGTISDRECQMINGVLHRMTGSGLPDDQVKETITKLGKLPFDDGKELQRLIVSMPREDRELVLKCAFLAGVSDSGLSDAEADRIDEVALALGLASDEARLLLERLSADLTASASAEKRAAV